MVQALLEAWVWLVPAFAVGTMGGWYARHRIDIEREHNLEGEVARDEGRIAELQQHVQQDEVRIHELEDELSAYRRQRLASMPPPRRAAV